MYALGQVTFEDLPSFAAPTTGPAAIITMPSEGSSLPGLLVVAGLGLAVWFFLRRGRRGSSRFVGRAFGDAKRRRKNPKKRRRNVMVWGG